MLSGESCGLCSCLRSNDMIHEVAVVERKEVEKRGVRFGIETWTTAIDFKEIEGEKE
jgi:hypothetical protein